MAQCVSFNSGDQDSGEQDISHLPVEEVYSVVGTWHQSGLGAACVISFRALGKWMKRTQRKTCWHLVSDRNSDTKDFIVGLLGPVSAPFFGHGSLLLSRYGMFTCGTPRFEWTWGRKSKQRGSLFIGFREEVLWPHCNELWETRGHKTAARSLFLRQRRSDILRLDFPFLHT